MYAKRLGLKRPYGKEKTSQICKRKADDTKHTAKITIVYVDMQWKPSILH